jgi:hypothetical protein
MEVLSRELRQKAQVVFKEQTQIIYTVAQHGHALKT